MNNEPIYNSFGFWFSFEEVMEERKIMAELERHRRKEYWRVKTPLESLHDCTHL
jgi:hypothetical protein